MGLDRGTVRGGPRDVKFRFMNSGRPEQKTSVPAPLSETAHIMDPLVCDKRGSTVVSDVRESIVTVGDGNQVLIEQLHVHFEPTSEPSQENAAKPTQSLQSSGSVIAPSIRRSRELLLGKVHDFWIRGVLERNLHGVAAAQLGFEPRPQALSNPWELLIDEVELVRPELPPHPTIFDLYSASRGRLLVVGAAGSGKTTLLLQLARVLVERAKADDTQPIPIILTLGTWTQGHRGSADWIERELDARYDVPGRISRQWLQDGELILLLDGLEEIPSAERSQCIVATNEFLRDKPCGVVVCSREVEYSSAEIQLRLNAAVRVEPLSQEEIKAYVSGQGSRLVALQKALDADAQLLTLAQTPLFLNIMSLAYEGSDELEATDQPLESTREEVLRAYVQKMTKEGRRPTKFSARQTTHWLTSLASRMMANNVQVFDFHQLQSHWLQSRREKRTFGIILQLTLRLFTALCFGLPTGINVGATEGMLFALIGFWSAGRSTGAPSILPVQTIGWSSSRFKKNLLPAFKNGASWGLLWGGLLLLRGDAAGAIFWMVSIGLASALADSVLGGLEAREVSPSVEPGMAIWKSARSALLAGVISGGVGSLVAVLLLETAKHLFGLNVRLADSIVLWLSIGFITAAFQYGGQAFLSHWILRCLLWTEGSLPFNLQHFLDHVVRRTFMCRVGEGYIFVHRLPMEYFAAKNIATEDKGEFAIRRRWYFAAAALLAVSLAALASLTGAVVIDRIRMSSRANDASTRLQKGEYREAITAYDAILEAHEDYPWALFGRGYARLKLGQPELAISDYSKGLMKEPNNAAACVNRGAALLEVGKLQQALRDFQHVEELKSQQPELSYFLGKVFMDLGQPAKAKPYLTEYISSISTRLAATPPQDAALLLKWRGTAHLWLEEYEKAIEDFDRVLNSDLLSKEDLAARQELLLLRGYCIIGLGRYEEALAVFGSLAEVPSTRQWSLRGTAKTYYLRGQRSGLIKDFDGAIEALEHLDSSLAEDRLLLSSSYHSANRNGDAIATAIAVTKAAPDDSYRARAWASLSWYYIFERQFEKAISSAQEAQRLNPQLKAYMMNAAHAYLFLGREAEARTLYRDNQHLSWGGKSWPFMIVEDFAELKSRGISHPAMEAIGREMQGLLREKSAVH